MSERRVKHHMFPLCVSQQNFRVLCYVVRVKYTLMKLVPHTCLEGQPDAQTAMVLMSPSASCVKISFLPQA